MDTAGPPGMDIALRCKNTAASAAVVVLACVTYSLLPAHQQALRQLHGPPAVAFSGRDFLLIAASLYILVLAVYLMTEPAPGVSKSLRFFRVVAEWTRAPAASLRGGLSPEDRLAVLSTLLKSFFGPLMTVSLMGFCMEAWVNGLALAQAGIPPGGLRPVFDHIGFWFLMQVILFIDVFVFTLGYLVESRRLGNEIRSVDPTLLGWVAALLCYPPFNSLSSKLLGSPHVDFPQFANTTLHLSLNLLLLALMAIYASASVALGLKASNLTHRGIVARGPYSVVRHPAYACKNLAWWIGAMPLIDAFFDQSLADGVQAAASMLAWSLLYLMRALTEEDHLRRIDGAYADYAARVRYRFVPGLI